MKENDGAVPSVTLSAHEESFFLDKGIGGVSGVFKILDGVGAHESFPVFDVSIIDRLFSDSLYLVFGLEIKKEIRVRANLFAC